MPVGKERMPQELRARLDPLLRDIGFARLLGIEVAEWELGRAVTRVAAGETQSNVHGTIHGAALFALLDTAFEVACNSYGRVAVGLDVSVHYAAPAHAGDVFTASADEISRSRRVASYGIDVRGEDGAVRCTALAVAFRTDRWHLGEDAWPPEWRARY